MPAQFTLTVLDADGSKQKHDVAPGTYYAGRDPGCHIVLAAADVSRRHARLVLDKDEFSIEDLESTEGTMVDGKRLKDLRRFSYPQTVQFGSVTMVIEPARPLTARTAEVPLPREDEVTITVSVDATDRSHIPVQGMAEQMAQRLQMLYDLPLQFAAEPDLKKLFKLILRGVMELIPGAKRGALLIIEPSSGKLALRAGIPEENPPVSRTLILRAAQQQHGFIWSDEQDNATEAVSIMNLHIRTGMYVPLLWKGQTVGVLCVDNPKHRAVFRNEDLQFMISVAHYAAAAVANQILQDDIESNNRTLQHLLANFSPKLRNKLLQKSRAGRLQLGGEKSDVTILMSDLRDFTRTSASLDSEVVMAMLNDYFSVLGDIIFQHDGTIDKFIGDAILAVFGSPEPDAEHALKAVQAAMAMQEAVAKINARRRMNSLPCCELGIGVHTGEVLHGFIGAAERMEFTVIGDTVNKASLYCDGAAAGEITLGPRTNAAVNNRLRTEARTINTKHEDDLEAYFVRGTL